MQAGGRGASWEALSCPLSSGWKPVSATSLVVSLALTAEQEHSFTEEPVGAPAEAQDRSRTGAEAVAVLSGTPDTELVRAIVGFPAVVVVDEPLLLRALEVYEVERLDFAEAYLVANAEASGVGTIASFDRQIDRLTTVRRLEPS